MSSDLYREIILDYYRNPRNYGKIDNPDIEAKDSNPLCGDVIEIQMKLDSENRVKNIKFNGQGCAISQASASMLTEMVMDKTLDEVRKIDNKDILEALGIPEIGSSRMKCALLPLRVLKSALNKYFGQSTIMSSDDGEH